MAGGTLPKSFQTPNEFNVCGGIEAAFMSTSVTRDVAAAYASSSDGPGLLFSIEQACGRAPRAASAPHTAHLQQHTRRTWRPRAASATRAASAPPL